MSSPFLGPWALLAFVALVAATAWALCGPRARHATDAVVGVAVWSSALVVGYTTILSIVRALGAAELLALAAAGAAAAWGGRLRPRAPAASSFSAPTRDDVRAALACAPLALFVLAMAHTACTAPETGQDNLAYHLPRLGYWQQQRAAAPFLAGNVRAGSFPPNGNVLQLPPVLFLGHDRFCGLVQLGAAVLTSVAIHGIARALGATALGASLAALLWFAIPCMLEQAARSLVDLTASFFVASAAFFLARSSGGAYGPVSVLVCVAIAVGVKTPTLVFGLPLAVAALWRLGRESGRLLAGVAALGPVAWLALGGYYHLQCARVWSDSKGLASIRWVVMYPSLDSLRKNAELVVLPLLSLLEGPREGSLPRALWAAVTGYGFGVGWLAMAALTGIALFVSLLRSFGGVRWWAALWALGVGGAIVSCFALRHQDAVLRFLLPAAALVTPTFAWTLDRVARAGWKRVALVGIVWLGMAPVLWRWDGYERAARRRDGRKLTRSERFGPELQPLALTIGRIDLGPGARWGVLAPDYFPESILFGPRYRNQLVPLSYDPPQSLVELEGLELEALWVGASERCTMTLFRRDFATPPARPQQNRRARAASYDEDFVQAFGESVYRVDLGPTLRALADPASPWRLLESTPRGALFVRDRGRRFDVRELCGEG